MSENLITEKPGTSDFSVAVTNPDLFPDELKAENISTWIATG